MFASEAPSRKKSLDEVVSYCLSKNCCREIILQYFSENSEVRCQNACANCKNKEPLCKETSLKLQRTYVSV